MWLPGRGPACHMLAWDTGRQDQAVQMCEEECRCSGGGRMDGGSGCPHGLGLPWFSSASRAGLRWGTETCSLIQSITVWGQPLSGLNPLPFWYTIKGDGWDCWVHFSFRIPTNPESRVESHDLDTNLRKRKFIYLSSTLLNDPNYLKRFLFFSRNVFCIHFLSRHSFVNVFNILVKCLRHNIVGRVNGVAEG